MLSLNHDRESSVHICVHFMMLQFMLSQLTPAVILCAFYTATYRSEEFDLIHRRLRVVLRTLHHLHCNKPLHPATTEKVRLLTGSTV